MDAEEEAIPVFSFGEKFQQLWAQIPSIVTYRDYVAMDNAIDDAHTGYEITERDENTLRVALNVFRAARGIPEKDPEWRE